MSRQGTFQNERPSQRTKWRETGKFTAWTRRDGEATETELWKWLWRGAEEDEV